MKDLIKRLTECYGPSGNESAVRDLIREEIKAAGALKKKGAELVTDPLGSLILHFPGKGGGKRVMLAAHMDEIGIVVTYVDDKGFLRFGNVGGVRPLHLMGGRVAFAGGEIGVIGLEKLEENGKIPSLDKFYIDVGAGGRDSCRIRIGDTACFVRSFEDFGERLAAKAMDDRAGCAVLLHSLRELAGSPHDIYFVFTVQEEVGLRGATTSGYGVDPEIALAVDVTLTGDTPECPHMAVSLGAGPAIKVKDGGMLSHPGVKNWLVRTAEGGSIPYQLEVLEGGTTDARAIQTSRGGVPTGCVSIPCRYVHSPSEMIDYNDALGASRLLVRALSGPIDLD